MFSANRGAIIIPQGKSHLGLQIFTCILDTVAVYKNLLIVFCNYIDFLLAGNQESTSKSMYHIFTRIRAIICQLNFL